MSDDSVADNYSSFYTSCSIVMVDVGVFFDVISDVSVVCCVSSASDNVEFATD